MHSDYFAEGQRVVGHWQGRGAAELGLVSEVTERQFEAVREYTTRCPFEFLDTPSVSPIVWPGTDSARTSSVSCSFGVEASSSCYCRWRACASGLFPPPCPRRATPVVTTHRADIETIADQRVIASSPWANGTRKSPTEQPPEEEFER